ncbi:hypothetical protein N7489_011652 [Penicillium chrysogenum]|uniref:uncharacterized protein n=1 Tax=Penicillium chrysogenum TaxID=5076 RepID=UPI0024DF20CE|nr:uncharacterized protein N7489_011652 [Penicillium chrysogenum]KAJ5230944.1 hypothetical protein N7489_011652 [Penicillium chrysogenum]
MINILDCPTEILWIIASTLQGSDISTLARTHSTLYPKLRLALIKYNIRHQKSSALHWAAKTNDRPFAKTLLSYRADVDAMVDGLSPLMMAAKHGSELVTDLLLRKGKPRVNMRNENGICALWYGVEKGSVAVVDQLLQHSRVKIDLPNREGQTVLWLAVFRSNRDLVSLLLSRGANPDTTDRYGISPWIQSCIRDRNSIKYLLLDHMKAMSPEMFSKDSVFAGNGETICEGTSSNKEGQIQLRTKRVRFAHV